MTGLLKLSKPSGGPQADEKNKTTGKDLYDAQDHYTKENRKGRVYITYMVEGVRYREYNGNRLGLKIQPNRCKNENDKFRHLNLLRAEYHRALKSGWTPADERFVVPALRDALQQVLKDKLSSGLSLTYQRNLVAIHRMFVKFLNTHELNAVYDRLKLSRVETFLNQFRSGRSC